MTAVATLAGAPPYEAIDWSNINWKKVHRNVRRLQARIVKAIEAGRWGKVKALQWLLTHSFSGKALAVRRVTENRGKKTPGVDGEIWDTPKKKARAIQSLRQRGYRAQPLRRTYIPKRDGKRQRPLGIPTMRDRAMQALYKLALDPIAETTGDPNSYGFRRERSPADAIAQCFLCFRLTSVFFHGAYKESELVDFGYSRDHRPGKPQIVIALNTTADGEVPLPGGCGVHNGQTADVDTPVDNMQRLQATFRRTDLLVTGDRAMQSAENMLAIARAHGRYLGPLMLTDTQKALMARIPEVEFERLPYSDQAGRLYRAVLRRFWFEVKEPLSAAARERLRRVGEVAGGCRAIERSASGCGRRCSWTRRNGSAMQPSGSDC